MYRCTAMHWMVEPDIRSRAERPGPDGGHLEGVKAEVLQETVEEGEDRPRHRARARGVAKGGSAPLTGRIPKPWGLAIWV